MALAGQPRVSTVTRAHALACCSPTGRPGHRRGPQGIQRVSQLARAALAGQGTRIERHDGLDARSPQPALCLPKILSAQVGMAIWFRRGPNELVARRRSARCSMMDGCAAATGLPGCDERVRVVTTCWLRPGC